MADQPPQHLEMSQWSASDFLRAQQERGWRPENPAYAAAKSEALEKAGLEPEQVPLDFDAMTSEQIQNLTAAEHLDRLARRHR
jgi:hypothetical protein